VRKGTEGHLQRSVASAEKPLWIVAKKKKIPR
jgi:hypothetical protein